MALFSIIDTLLSLTLAAIAWWRGSAPGAPALVGLNLDAAWWMLCYVIPLPINGLSEQIFFPFRLIFPGVVVIAPALLVFVLQYTGHPNGTAAFGRWEGATLDFLLTARRDLAAASRFLERAIGKHGLPNKITIDKSGTDTAAVHVTQEDTGAPL